MKKRLFILLLSFILLFSLIGCSVSGFGANYISQRYSNIFTRIHECYNLDLETRGSAVYGYNKTTHIVYIVSSDGATPLISENGYYLRYNEESGKVLELTPEVQEDLLNEKEGK